LVSFQQWDRDGHDLWKSMVNYWGKGDCVNASGPLMGLVKSFIKIIQSLVKLVDNARLEKKNMVQLEATSWLIDNPI
jgi:hypothetical protein